MLDKLFTIAFLLLALSSSRMMIRARRHCCHDVKGDASLYSFPVTLGFFMLQKPAFFRVASFQFGDGGCIEH